MSTYNKVAGALDESRALLAEVMAELTAAAERERVLREALEYIGCLYRNDPDDPPRMCAQEYPCLRCAALEATK